MAITVFLKKFWAFVKKYWQLFTLIIGVIVGAFLLRSRDTQFIDDVRKIKEAHDSEIKKIEAAREEERKQNEANLARLKSTLAEVEKQYKQQQQQLDNKKKKEIEVIVKDYGDDPIELAKKISEVTGFTVILPT